MISTSLDGAQRHTPQKTAKEKREGQGEKKESHHGERDGIRWIGNRERNVLYGTDGTYASKPVKAEVQQRKDHEQKDTQPAAFYMDQIRTHGERGKQHQSIQSAQPGITRRRGCSEGQRGSFRNPEEETLNVGGGQGGSLKNRCDASHAWLSVLQQIRPFAGTRSKACGAGRDKRTDCSYAAVVANLEVKDPLPNTLQPLTHLPQPIQRLSSILYS